MISHINGRLSKRNDSSVIIDANNISYEVLIPPAVMSSLDSIIRKDGSVKLVTYHYHQVDQSRSVPVLIGFLNNIEKDFFVQFITVSGIGPKAACRALSQPISVIADAIDNADLLLLKTLPGIGEQRAREIIAKLQGKIGKFGLIQDRKKVAISKMEEDVRQEALSVLLQLQYRKKEAEDMIQNALSRNPKAKNCEDILNEVYRQKSKDSSKS